MASPAIRSLPRRALDGGSLGEPGTRFAGYCRDADVTGSFAEPAEPCFENGRVIGSCLQPFESCEQRNQGAFGPGAGGVMTITAFGSPPRGLCAGPRPGVLATIFGIAPTFNALADAVIAPAARADRAAAA